MKVSDIKIGEVYKTTNDTTWWCKGDFFKVEGILGDEDGNPTIRGNFNYGDPQQKVFRSGVWYLAEGDIECPIQDATAKPDPTTPLVLPAWDPNSPTPPDAVENRVIGYLSALDPQAFGSGPKSKAVIIQFLNHIGYQEVSTLFERFK